MADCTGGAEGSPQAAANLSERLGGTLDALPERYRCWSKTAMI